LVVGGLKLETKNIMIFGVWTFVIVITIGLFWRPGEVVGIGGPFVASLLVFLAAMIFSYYVIEMKPVKKE
jgi:hypothetical protein